MDIPSLGYLMRHLLLLSCCIGGGGFGFHKAITSKSAIRMSLGDPDLGGKWSLLREVVQPLARSLDAAVCDDPDLPGLTFPTPVIWAPWYACNRLYPLTSLISS